MDQKELGDLSKGIRAFHEGHYETAIKLLTPLADNGNAEAQYNVAMLYLDGEGGKYKSNYDEALKWLNLSVEQNHPQAIHELAGLYYYEGGLAQDKAKGISLFKKAVELDYALAKASLGWALIYDDEIEKDLDKGLMLLNEAISEGEAIASYFLGFIYHKGIKKNEVFLINPDIHRAIELYETAANMKNADAAFNLFHIFFYERGLNQDQEKALKYLKMGADNYHGPSQFQLGLFYLNGQIVEQDLSEAERYFMLSAFKGDNEARVMLGVTIEQRIDEGAYDEKGLEDFKQGQIDMIFKCLHFAAEEKYPLALHQLGIRYATGNKIEQDYKKAILFFEQAHDLDYPESTNSLGIMYLQGEGVKKDESKALEYFKAAAIKGIRPSQTNSAILLEELANNHPEGTDEHSDLIRESLDMLKLAADQNHTPSKYNFARLCIQNLIHKDLVKDPFTFFGKEDYMPYLEDAVAEGYEPAIILLETVRKVESETKHKEKIKSESSEFDKFFKKNKIKKVSDLSKIIRRDRIVPFFDSIVKKENREIDIHDLLSICNIGNLNHDEFLYYLEVKEFILESYRSNFVNIFDLIQALEGFDCMRILHTIRSQTSEDNGDTSNILEDEYWILNDLLNKNQYLLKFYEDADYTRILCLGKNKKYSSRSLKEIFKKEQLLFNEEISQIHYHRKLLDKKDKYIATGWNGVPLKDLNYFKPLKEKLINNNEEQLIENILCYPTTSFFSNATLPMNKSDCISFMTEKESHANLLLMQEKFKSDKDIVRIAVSLWGWNIKYASKKLQNDPEIKDISDKNIKKEKKRILNYIKKGQSYDFFSQYDQMLTGDRDIVLAAVSVNGSLLGDVDSIFKKDREIVLAACKNNGDSLFEADSKLQRDEEIVRAAINNDPQVLFNTANKYRLDFDLNLEVISKNGFLSDRMEKKLKKNKEILIKAIQSEPMGWSDEEWGYTTPEFVLPILFHFDEKLISEEIFLMAIKRELELKEKVFDYHIQRGATKEELDDTMLNNAHELIFSTSLDNSKSFYIKVSKIWPELVMNLHDRITLDKDILREAGYKSNIHILNDLGKKQLESKIKKVVKCNFSKSSFKHVFQDQDSDNLFKLYHSYCKEANHQLLCTEEEYSFKIDGSDDVYDGDKFYANIKNYIFENKFPYPLKHYFEEYYEYSDSDDFPNYSTCNNIKIDKVNAEYILNFKSETNKKNFDEGAYKSRILEDFKYYFTDYYSNKLFISDKNFNLYDRFISRELHTDDLIYNWELNPIMSKTSLLYRVDSNTNNKKFYHFREIFEENEDICLSIKLDENGNVCKYFINERETKVSKKEFNGLKEKVIKRIPVLSS